MEIVGQIAEGLRVCVVEGVIALAVLLLALLAGLCARFVLRRLGLFLRMGLCGIVLAVAAVLVSDKPPGRMENGEWKMENEVLAHRARIIVHSPFSILHSNGWREVSRSTDALGDSVFAVPEDGLVWDEARARGARRGYWHIPATDWSFPGAGFGWTNGFVWTEGMFSPKVESKRDGLVILNHGLALAPAANWERHGLDASLFWCRTNAVGGLVGTFLGAAVDDDPARIVNAQFELFPADGRIALRYDLSRAGEEMFEAGPFEDGEGRFVSLATNTSEVVLQRVHPDDWDMDGIPNVLDEEPRVPNTTPAWGQSEEWAALAFPSNAAEIAAAGSYLAWATARGGETNRHLVGLNIESPDGVWPICLTFGELQVMCNSTNTLYFAIDDGARYAFSLSRGAKLAALEVAGSETLWARWEDWYEPYEQHSHGVGLRLDSPASGWVGRTATVQVADLEPDHFYPETPRQVSASVTNCHEGVFIDCEWRGPAGFTFSNPNSLTTSVEWNGSETWGSGFVDLITRYEGPYAVTNHMFVTLGTQPEPSVSFSLGCQDTFFLNDAEHLGTASCTNNRPERIRPVSLNLQAPLGSEGHVTLAASGSAAPVLLLVEGDTTNLITSVAQLPVSVVDRTRTADRQIFVSCPRLGRGEIQATLVLANGESISADPVSFRCIEPLRKLVTKDEYPFDGRIVNPSRLVMGTNAVLKVGVNCSSEEGAEFAEEEVSWHVVSGPGKLIVSNGWHAVVKPTADNGEDVVVEARFNGDEIQPRFTLPVVQPRVIPLRFFIADPPLGAPDAGWRIADVEKIVSVANHIYEQVGIKFLIESVTSHLDGKYWNLPSDSVYTNSVGRLASRFHPTTEELLKSKPAGRFVKVYCLGTVSPTEDGRPARAWKTSRGILLSKKAKDTTLAHELGHVLWLDDCYAVYGDYSLVRNRYPVSQSDFFNGGDVDWQMESGRGFYETGDIVSKILSKMIMNGRSTEARCDIPGAFVLSLPRFPTLEKGTRLSPVGASCIQSDSSRIFSK